MTQSVNGENPPSGTDTSGTAPSNTARRSKILDIDFELDAAPGSLARIGLVLLATDLATEREIARVVPQVGPHGDAVSWFVSRVTNANPTTIENLRRMADQLPEASARILPGARVDALAYSCTSGTIVLGEDYTLARLAEGRPGVPATTPVTASRAAFRALGVRKVAVLTPYVEEVNKIIAGYLEQHGYEVTALSTFNLESDEDMAAVPADALQRAGRLADTPDADALFISCTAFQAVTSVAPLERALGKPVVTSNQALFWHALHLAGAGEVPLEGYGRLFGLVPDDA